MNVLVTNAKSRIAYNIVKSLARRGDTLHCADFVPHAMTFHSRYCKGHFLYPSPFTAQRLFVDRLLEEIDRRKIDVLIPVFEELFLVARHKEEFSRQVRMAIPEYSQILIAHNKDRWEPVARKLGISVPLTCSADELARQPERIGEFCFPALLKPKQGGGGWGMRRVDSSRELLGILRNGRHEDLPLERFLLQEIIRGDTHCVAMIFSHGRLRGICSYRQRREYPSFGGQATCRIGISHPGAESALQKLLEHLDWHGVCQADFLIDRVRNEPYLIDINPRFWGSLVQAVASGVDFPYLLREIASAGDVEPVEGFREGVETRWLGGELRGFLHHLAAAERKGAFLRDFFLPPCPPTQLDDFSWQDPWPFFVWACDSLYRTMKLRSRPHESLQGIWE